MIRPLVLVSLLAVTLCVTSKSRADEPQIKSVKLLLDVTWDGKRGVQVPITPGSTETLRGACPPIIEINSKFDPGEPIDVDAQYRKSDGTTLDRKQKTFMSGLYTESWEIPIHDPGQEFTGSVTLHINSPGVAKNDVSVSFSVACASKSDPVVTCDPSGDRCHKGLQLGAPVKTTISASPPPRSWAGGTIEPGTYVLTAVKQYTYKDMKVTDDGKASQATVYIKKSGAGITAEMVATDGTCTQRSALDVTQNPPVIPGALAKEYEPVFTGAHAFSIKQSCPGDASSFALPSAYAVTKSGFEVMPLTGTVLSFTRKQ